MFLADRYLKRRFREGVEIGRAEVDREWNDWNQRRLAAQKEGRPFNEPTPSRSNRS